MKTRILLGSLLIGILGGVFWLDHFYGQGHLFFLFLLLVVSIGGVEFFHLVGIEGRKKWLGVLGVVFLPCLTWVEVQWGVELSFLGLVFVFWGIYFAFFAVSPSPKAYCELGLVVFGMVYLGWMSSFYLRLRAHSFGEFWLLYTLLVSKGTDIFAYFSGTWWGRHKWMPSISPKKTWEGLLGGMAGAGLVGCGLGFWMSGNLNFDWYSWLPVSIILGGLAQLGDLAESFLKRSFGAKDSGKWFPEFGGVLDLVDSLLLTGPVVYFCVAWKVLS